MKTLTEPFVGTVTGIAIVGYISRFEKPDLSTKPREESSEDSRGVPLDSSTPIGGETVFVCGIEAVTDFNEDIIHAKNRTIGGKVTKATGLATTS